MKRIIVVCEGPTEQEFCKDVLQPFFSEQKIYIQYPTIKKSGGGIVAWKTLKKQIENHLLQDKTAFVTTLIDYYGIHPNHEFPLWDNSLKIGNKFQRMDFLESSMKNDLSLEINNRFIPYIQLHEFEGLLFNNIDVFIDNIPESEFLNKVELTQTIVNNPNPELINDTPDNAPSYRLRRLIKGYNKIIYGSIIAQCIGLENIRSKSFRFNNWIENML